MSKTTLVLGPVVFQDFEVPSTICFGGAQRLAVHRLPGGGRVVDALGPDDGVIFFSGIFSGSDAAERALALDALRSAGAPLPLTWDVFFYTVVITDFTANFQSSWWIPYRLACTVIQSAIGAAVAVAGSLATAIQSDLVTAATLPTSVDFSAAQTAVSQDGGVTYGSAAYTQAQTSLAATQDDISAGLTSAQAQLADTGGSNLLGAANAAQAISSLNSATSAAGQLSALATAQAYVGRAAVNLSNAST